MNAFIPLCRLSLPALLAFATGLQAEPFWLDAEVRAQEARWEAQQGKTAPLRPIGQVAVPAAEKGVKAAQRARPTRDRERPLQFPSLAAGARPDPPAGAQPIAPRPFPTSSAMASTRDYSQTLLALANQHGLDPLLMRAVMLAESAGKARARSPKGAIGLMQLMPATARRFGVDPYDPPQNILGGARYLRFLMDYFNGDVTRAIAGYNAGEGAVDKYGGVPPYRETRNYVTRVLGYHEALRQTASTRSQ